MMRKTFLAAACAALSFSPAMPAAAQFRYDFKKSPNAAQIQAAWPAEAKAAGVTGSAGAVCEVKRSGQLTDCKVVFEAPAGKGFGAALVGLAPAYRLVQIPPKCADIFHQAVIVADWPKLDTEPKRLNNSKEDLRILYPRNALNNGVWGGVVVNCWTQLDTSVKCDVVHETPAGHGFGQAALMMTEYMKVQPGTRGGQPVSSPITLPMTFTGKSAFAVATNCSTR